MPYTINHPALDRFISDQVTLVESTPMPGDLHDVLPEQADDLTADELGAVWLGAGLATQIGLALLEPPERFIEHTTRSTVSA